LRGITTKCSLCFAVVIVIVSVSVLVLLLFTGSPPVEAICIHNMQAKSESELKPENGNCGKRRCPRLPILSFSSLPLHPWYYQFQLQLSFYPYLKNHMTCDRCSQGFMLRHRLSQANLLASSAARLRGFCRALLARSLKQFLALAFNLQLQWLQNL